MINDVWISHLFQMSKLTKKTTTGLLSNNVPICLTVISVYDSKTVQKNPPKSIQNSPKNKIPARAPLQLWRLHIPGGSLISWQELPLTQLQRREVAIYSQSASIYPEDVNFPPCPGSLLEETPKALKYSQRRQIISLWLTVPRRSSLTPKAARHQSYALLKLHSQLFRLKTQQMDHSSQTCGSTFEGSNFFLKSLDPHEANAQQFCHLYRRCAVSWMKLSEKFSRS